MKQIIRSLAIALGLATVVGTQALAAATSFDKVQGEFSWPVGDESNVTISKLGDALLSAGVSVGTDLTTSHNQAYAYDGLKLAADALVLYQPATSSAGFASGDMVEYKVKLKKGLKLSVSTVSFDAVKEGTDGAYFGWSYVVDGKESEQTNLDAGKIIRNNGSNASSASLNHVLTLNAAEGREFALRFYISGTASNKKVGIGNIKISGSVSGEVEVRKFVDFAVDFRTESGIVVSKPESGSLPEGVTIEGAFHDAQHGNGSTTIVVPVDGPVKFTIGSCQYGVHTTVVKDAAGNELVKLDTNNGCDDNTSTNKFVTWVYNSEEPTTLTFDVKEYLPFFSAEACELLPMVKVLYYDTDAKTVLLEEELQGGSALTYSVTADKVKVAEGLVFRGWFTSTQTTATKIAEGYLVQDNLKLYARATKAEEVSSTARYIYDLTKQSFYVEDHECIDIDGKYYNSHGWLLNGGTIKLKVAGRAYITIGNCAYSAEAEAVVTNAEGAEVTRFTPKSATDGAETTFKYDGPATTLTITFPAAACYVHNVKISNVVDFVDFNETTGYYVIPAGDVSSFLLALSDASARDGAKIFLPNGTYDLGETVLTRITGNNISIIGESMTGTIIVNAPDKSIEGIGTTATLLNSSSNLYLQDLTLQNALDYYGSGAAGRAVCLQDKGSNTICKNVRMLSYQDTYYSNSSSNFYWEDCEIHGTVDYVCGGGDVVYNRTLFVNESRSKTGASGDATIAAPNGAKKFGYVMLDCGIKNNCASFNFGRSWGEPSKLAYIRTTIFDGKLASSRFTIAGMNCAATKFVEYGTMGPNSTDIITPTSNKLTFTHKNGNHTYETVLSADSAAAFTIENIFGAWAPDAIAAQLAVPAVKKEGNVSSWDAVEGATAYLVTVDGKFAAILPASTLSYEAEGVVAVRAANTRGGFSGSIGAGLEARVSDSPAEENAEPVINADKNVVSVVYYSLNGMQSATPFLGLVNVIKTVYSDGTSSVDKKIIRK